MRAEVKAEEDAERERGGLGGGSVGLSVNTEPERVRGRWGVIENDKDDGGKEGRRKLGEFIRQTGHAHTHTQAR